MWPSTNSIVKHLISQHHPHQKHQYHRYYINRLQNRSIRAPLYYLPSKLTSKSTISLLLLSVSRLISSIRIVLHSFPLIFYCSAILLLFLLKTCTGSSAIDHRHQHNVSRNDNDNVNYNSTHHHINRFSNHLFMLNDSPPNDHTIRWTEENQLPTQWRYSVRPSLILNKNQLNRIRLLLRIDHETRDHLINGTLSLIELELYNINDDMDHFIAAHYVGMHHRLVSDDYNDDHITESRQFTSINEQSNGNVTHIILEWFNQVHQMPVECQFFTGKIVYVHNILLSSMPSFATFSLCTTGRLNGIITLPDHGHILVEPSNIDQTDCQSIKRSSKNGQNLSSLHENGDQSYEMCQHRFTFMQFSEDVHQQSIPIRMKRSFSHERTIEVMVVTDREMLKFHRDNRNKLEQYVRTLMGSVAHIFKHSSIGNEINVKLMRLIVLDDQQQELSFFRGTAQNTLRQFCRWQNVNNYPDDAHPMHHDIAILLTRRDLCRVSAQDQHSTQCDTIGLAHSGQICDPESSCAIVEDTGLSAAFTIAHELGHVLGIPHDDEEKCKNYYATESKNHTKQHNKDSYVMARMIDVKKHVWSWSSCSRHFITEYLDSGYGDCLLDNTEMEQMSSDQQAMFHQHRRASFDDRLTTTPLGSTLGSASLAGEIYDANAQCSLIFGGNSKVCDDMPVCQRLWCTHSGEGCRTQHMPWADGTPCHPKNSMMWCQHGKCVTKNSSVSLGPVDGGWGRWSPYSNCSLPCGGGIKRSKRRCDNPSPQNGGKFCIGERIRYKSCNTHQCSKPTDIRKDQCAEFDGKNFKITNLDMNVRWVPHYTRDPNDVCKLHCANSVTGNYYMLKERVIDGTPCSPDSYDLCVNGKCLSAGCDRILGSNVTLDRCGVCGGDNSTCREISARFPRKSVNHGYNYVVRIPAGASNIEVSKDISSESWLVIQADDGNYLLNGGFTVNVYARKWHYGGATLEYSGTNKQHKERINTTRPIDRALFVQVLCVGDLIVGPIEYRYMMATKHEWTLDHWTECDYKCEQMRPAICISIMETESGERRAERAKDELCHGRKKPDIEFRACDFNCNFKWHIENLSSNEKHCSSKCGPGYRYRNVQCQSIKSINGVDESIHLVDNQYCMMNPKPSETEPCNGTECNIEYEWQYGDWSQCTLPKDGIQCGDGTQERSIQCISFRYFDQDHTPSMKTVVNNHECNHLGKPIKSRRCQVECPKWSVGHWTECSGRCGRGEMKRTVECTLSTHGIIPDQFCEQLGETRPDNRSHCNLPECNHYDQYGQFNDDISNHIIPPIPNKSFLPGYHGWDRTLHQDGFDTLTELNQTINNWKDGKHHGLPQPIDSLTTTTTTTTNGETLNNNNWSNEKIEWHTKAWSECQCDIQLQMYTHKREVRCVRVLPENMLQVIDDGYCSTIQPARIKPNQVEQCIPNGPRTLECWQQQLSDEPSSTSPSPKMVSIESTSSASEPILSSKLPTTSVSLLSLYTSLFESELKSTTPIQQQQQPSSTSTTTSTTTTTTTTTTTMRPTTKRSKKIRHQSKHRTISHQTESIPKLSFEWTEWSKCIYMNGSCGNGTQYREAICFKDNQRTPCKPITSRQTKFCFKLCSVYQWHYLDWSPCSSKCGTGTRTRMVECRDWTGVSVKATFCESNDLVTTEECHGDQCHIDETSPSSSPFSLSSSTTQSNINLTTINQLAHGTKLVWQTGHWSECSKSCGAGVQTRTVTCHRNNSHGFIVPESQSYPTVSSLNRRKRGRNVLRDQRTNYQRSWWSNGRQRKQRHNNEANYDYRETINPIMLKLVVKDQTWQWCDLSIKPPSIRSCTLGSCITDERHDSFVWKAYAWQPCRSPCGNGIQQRKVQCHSLRTGKRVNRDHCNPKLKPDRERKCNLRECQVISCQDMRDRGRTLRLQDGEYELWIQGTTIRVYCYGMSTDKPIEYLILNSATYDDNYSQLIYQSRNCSHSKMIKSVERSTKLYFKYVRLNISSLQIIADDTMFAVMKDSLDNELAHRSNDVVINSHSLGFGQAMVQSCDGTNDYDQNSILCGSEHLSLMKAMFSINLFKTGLIVAPDVNWKRIGPNEATTKYIKYSKSGEKIIGYCGHESMYYESRRRWCHFGCQPIENVIQLQVP